MEIFTYTKVFSSKIYLNIGIVYLLACVRAAVSCLFLIEFLGLSSGTRAHCSSFVCETLCVRSILEANFFLLSYVIRDPVLTTEGTEFLYHTISGDILSLHNLISTKTLYFNVSVAFE